MGACDFSRASVPQKDGLFTWARPLHPQSVGGLQKEPTQDRDDKGVLVTRLTLASEMGYFTSIHDEVAIIIY